MNRRVAARETGTAAATEAARVFQSLLHHAQHHPEKNANINRIMFLQTAATQVDIQDTRTNHRPAKCCGRSHRMLVRHIHPCSPDPFGSHPAPHTTGAYWSQLLAETSPGPPCTSRLLTFLNIPGPSNFALGDHCFAW